MQKIRILWADDEIDLLKPHIMFLEQKGYEVDTVTNGDDAIEQIDESPYDIVFLDENMPGLTGLETLTEIKEKDTSLPVIMITKSEEEYIMEDAIGQKISDYLIKPVNPNQILLSIKRNLDAKRLVSEKTQINYQQEFRKIGMELMDLRDHADWSEMYRKLVGWELRMDELDDSGMLEILQTQKTEANHLFSKFIENEYESWLNEADADRPVLSHELLRKYMIPQLSKERSTFLFVIDNLRFDQWKVLAPILNEYYAVEEEHLYYSILPTATQFARNALFAGLLPSEIHKRYPEWWVHDNEEGAKNGHEDDLVGELLKRSGKGDLRYSYHKVLRMDYGKKLVGNLKSLQQNALNVIVYNFVDMLSHAKTDMDMIKELADDDKAYRSLTQSWFRNSPLLEMLRDLAHSNARVFITTDHGTINVGEPTKVVGDREVNTNLRYKQGKNLSYDGKDVYAVSEPERIGLPKPNVSTKYLFAKDDLFFAYPNNYNHYVKYYRNTYQHGGISLEEVLVPFIELRAK